jgi:hypothetical protein
MALAAVLTNSVTGVYGQELSSSPVSSPVGSTTSAKFKAVMCDPGNPRLKVVNTTESKICGIPKTVKNATTTTTPSILPPISAVSSSTIQITKPRAAASTPSAPEQKQIANNNNNVLTSDIAAKQSPINILQTKSASSTSTIAPQVSSLNPLQLQQELQQSPAVSNLTAGDDSTLTPLSQTTTSGQIMYLGYHGTGGNTVDNSLKDNHSSSDIKSQSKNHAHHDTSSGNKTKKGSSKEHNNGKGSGGGGGIWGW